MEHVDLETAASYLIIIQNLEKSEVSQQVNLEFLVNSDQRHVEFVQFAQVLLQHALEKAKWELATDILRFIRSIGLFLNLKK